MSYSFFRPAAGLLVAAATLAGLCVTSLHAEGKLLRWKLPPGEKLHVTFTQQTNQETTVNNKPLRTAIEMVMEMDWTVSDVRPDGTTQMTQSFTRMKIKMKVPGADPIEYDSADEQRPEGPAGDVRRALRRLLGAPFQLTMNARGEILDVMLSDEAAAALARSPAAERLTGLLTPEGLNQMLRQSVVVLPEKAVEPGDTWSGQAETMSPLGTLKLKHEYTYEGTQQQGDQALEKITATTKFELAKRPAGTPPRLEIKSQEQTSTLLFDAAAGRFVETRTQQQLATETPYRDMLIRATVDSTLQMKIESSPAD